MVARFTVVLSGLWAILPGCGAEEGTCSIAVLQERRASTQVVINEVVAKSLDTTPDWIELYNRGTGQAEIGCWSVVDKSSKHTPFFIAPGVTLEPGGFLVLVRDKTGAAGFTWGFSTSGDTAVLRDSDGRIADETSWDAGQARAGGSWGRTPDGTGDFTTLLEPTMGAGNSGADPNPPVLPGP